MVAVLPWGDGAIACAVARRRPLQRFGAPAGHPTVPGVAPGRGGYSWKMRCPARWLRFGLLCGLACGLAGALTCQAEALAAGTLAGPVVTAISPNNGPQAGGTPLTITGSGFTAGSTVKVGHGAAASVTVDSSTSITARTPVDTGSVGRPTADKGTVDVT